jgi:hypothetical protein
VRLERVFAPGMDPKPPIRKRSRDLHLQVTGLEPLPVDVSIWERRLIERILNDAVAANAAKEAPDASPR